MNWYKYAFGDLQRAYEAVRSALMALKYLKPEIDPLTADFNELSAALAETGKIPPGVDPGRFAAMVIFYLKQHGEVEHL